MLSAPVDGLDLQPGTPTPHKCVPWVFSRFIGEVSEEHGLLKQDTSLDANAAVPEECSDPDLLSHRLRSVSALSLLFL